MKETVAVDASMARFPAGAAELEDALFSRVREKTESMIAWARSGEALGSGRYVLEERGMRDCMDLARELVRAHMDLREPREEPRDDVTDADGDPHRVREDGQERARVMVFGEVDTSRIACRRKGKPNLYPRDAELNWGPRRYPAGVERRIARAIAVVPAGQAAAQVSAQGAVTVGKRQAEETAIACAAGFEGFHASRRPGPCPGGMPLLLTFDGSAFPVLPSAPRPATAKAAAARAKAKEEEGWPDDPGELRKSKKRTAGLAAVADVVPARGRAAGDVLGALFGPARPGKGKEDAAKPGPGPKTRGRTLFASVKRPAAEVIADAFAEARRRDPEHGRDWIVVIDGNVRQIGTAEKLAEKHKVKIRILIDLIHVAQYAWKAANAFFYPAGRDWAREQVAKILAGKHRDVRAGIRRRASTLGLRGSERAGADECARYPENKQDYLDYPEFLAKGLPVASGLIEGAARWLIKDRMEVTGARRGHDSAEAVLKLRALVGCGDFEAYGRYHRQQEKIRNHDSHYQQPPGPVQDNPG
jgi:hypothetical protein